MTQRRWSPDSTFRVTCGVFFCLALAVGWTHRCLAEEGPVLTGALKTMHNRGTILIGYRESSLPFSFLNPAKQPVGFSVDICHGVAEDAARATNRELLEPDAPTWQNGLRIVYVPVAADQRLSMVVSGAVDLECGSTTANAERRKIVDFSPVFFLSGTKLIVTLDSRGRPKARSFRDLAGRTIAVSTGTTNADVVQRLAVTVSPPARVIQSAGLNEAYESLVAGKADAVASDDILLAGLIASHKAAGSLAIVGDFLSFEPYAIMFRRDDPQFAALIQASFRRMASEGLLSRLYNRWLMARLPTGERLSVPMSPHLSEMYRAFGQPD